MFLQSLVSLALAQALIAPTDPLHPGSKSYEYAAKQTKVSCLSRNVDVFHPDSAKLTNEKFPVIVFGHGQALNVEHYKLTFEHLAKKGIIVLHPQYDTGFFDQDWNRMASDYVKQTECALKGLPSAESSAVVFSGHSKGAYVASLAAGMVDATTLPFQLKANVFFAPAGSDNGWLKKYPKNSATTVVFSDADNIVSQNISDTIYQNAASQLKQFILLKSYTQPPLKANHFWVLTKSSFAGGKNGDSALHHHGLWKWLTAAADDLNDGVIGNHPYLYGPLAADKGVSGLMDDIQRNF